MNKKKDFLSLLIISLVTVVLWMVSEIYHSATTTRVSKEIADISIPVTPQIDAAVIDGLKERHPYPKDRNVR